MDEVLLGIDIGTSSCKVSAFTLEGQVIAQENTGYAVCYPRAGWAEQDPGLWWDAVCRGVRAVLRTVPASHIRAVGVDGQSWAAVAVDGQGQVLCNTPLWMDTRAQEICRELDHTVGGDRIFSVCGNPLQPMYTLPKILWYKRCLPEVYARATSILQSNSFIVFRLTGTVSQDPSQGYGLHCYDMKKGRWDLDLCGDMGVKASLLPPIFPCHAPVGGITAHAAAETGLPVGTPVVAGGLDAACGTLGAGVIRPGQTQEQGGQAGGMSICMADCVSDRRLILGAHVVDGLWLLQGGTVGGGAALHWYEREFGATERERAAQMGTSPFAELDEGARAISPGSDGLVFLPYLAGERSPLWDPNAKGVFHGIDFSKTRAHFTRAVMEGVAYSLRHNLETAREAGVHAGTLHAMGGAANSPLWTQIKADVTGKAIAVPSTDTATALGAAILAGVGVGLFKNFEQAVRATVHIRRMHEPDAACRAAYDEGYHVYRTLYERLKNMN